MNWQGQDTRASIMIALSHRFWRLQVFAWYALFGVSRGDNAMLCMQGIVIITTV